MSLFILSLMFASGIVTGIIVGLLTAGIFTQRKLARKEKETWAQAENFYRRTSARS